MHEGQEMGVELVVSRSDAAKLLEAAEQPLDGVALSVAGGIVSARRASSATSGSES
jgi:hypothetical protein